MTGGLLGGPRTELGQWLRSLTARGVPVTFLSPTVSESFYNVVPRITGLPMASFDRFFVYVARSNLLCDIAEKPQILRLVARIRHEM